MSSLSFAEGFMKENPQDTFTNLKREEDISTIYHNEYVDGRDVSNYWCTTPMGFKFPSDVILGIFQDKYGIAIAVEFNNGNPLYSFLVKNRYNLPRQLTSLGISACQKYTDEEIRRLIQLI